MSKKEKNILQNKRNNKINNRYYSKIKFLSKYFLKFLKISPECQEYKEEKKKIKLFLSQLYSTLDKAVKKDVIHQNIAAKSKSYFFNISKNLEINKL